MQKLDKYVNKYVKIDYFLPIWCSYA